MAKVHVGIYRHYSKVAVACASVLNEDFVSKCVTQIGGMMNDIEKLKGV